MQRHEQLSLHAGLLATIDYRVFYINMKDRLYTDPTNRLNLYSTYVLDDYYQRALLASGL